MHLCHYEVLPQVLPLSSSEAPLRAHLKPPSELTWSLRPVDVTHLVAMVLEELHFLLGEGCHGD